MDELKTDRLMAPIEGFLDRLGVEHVYGAPQVVGDATIIPVAEVVMGFGYGMGEGTGPAASTEGATAGEAAAGGRGGGGGAGGRATPRGYIRIDPTGVSYKPIIDEQRLAVAGMLLAAWIVFWVGRTIRSVAKAVASLAGQPSAKLGG